MNRRRVLDGLIGLSVLSTAGCLGSDSDTTNSDDPGSTDSGPTTEDSGTDSGSSTPTDREESTTEDRPDSTTADRRDSTTEDGEDSTTEDRPNSTTGGDSGRITEVRNRQTRAAKSLRTNVESFLTADSGVDSVGTDGATRHLDEAGETLADLGGGETVDRLQQANKWLRSIVAAIGEFNDGYGGLLKAISQRRKDNVDAAKSLAEGAGKKFSSAKASFEEAARTGQELGNSQYARRSEAAFSAAASVLVKMAKTTGAQQSLSKGYGHEIDGKTWLTSALVDFNTGKYSRAAGKFADSKRFYDAAFEAYTTARERAPSEVEAVFDPFVCRAKSLYDATIHFETAATAADQGRSNLAEREFRAGQNDRKHGCFSN